MFRVLLLAGGLFAMTSDARSQSDPVKERNTLMYEMGERAYGEFNKMVRGEQPYDQAKVDAGFAKIAENAPKLTGLWPPGTNKAAEGSDFHSSPKLWDNMADFDAQLTKFQQQAAAHAGGKVKSLDELKVAFDELVRQQCNTCHQEYRVRNR
jgi:cytochrome c556